MIMTLQQAKSKYLIQAKTYYSPLGTCVFHWAQNLVSHYACYQKFAAQVLIVITLTKFKVKNQLKFVQVPQEPMDIAASIKALAKSVHGDAVFGDLPRPRFSSQI